MRSVSSAFWLALQQDGISICELIELSARTKTWRWTTNNQAMVNSGNTYEVFPGQTSSGIEESSDLGISTIDFVLVNSGNEFDQLLRADEIDMAAVVVRRVITTSPDAGDIEIYRGKVGDYAYNRNQITGQARNFFNSINVQWPYYTYMDQCTWRFGGTGCGYDTTSVTVSSTAYPVSSGYRLGALTDLSSMANGFYDRGRFAFTSGANSGQMRTVRVHTGTRIEFSHVVPYDVSSGDTFDLYPGCRKRILDDCTSKYNNTINALAFPFIPKQENAY